MQPEPICPVCFRPMTDDMPECWECGVPAILRKVTPSRPGVSDSSPGAAPEAARAFQLRAVLLPLLVLAGFLAYRGPWSSGRLTIQTEPPGAVVRVGNRTLGVTPLQLEGNAGQYWISIRMQDFESIDAQVVIPRQGKAVASVPLRPLLSHRRSVPADPSTSLHVADMQTTAHASQVLASRFGDTD